MRTSVIEGLPVVNARKSVVLHISPKDIKGSRMKDPAHCAAARACIRQLGCTEARVHLTRIYVRYNGKWERYYTPSSLRTEIVTFDRGGGFSAGEYKLMKMQPSREGDTSRDTKKRPKVNNRKRAYHFLSGVRVHA